jgi:hypothetical protein
MGLIGFVGKPHIANAVGTIVNATTSAESAGANLHCLVFICFPSRPANSRLPQR